MVTWEIERVTNPLQRPDIVYLPLDTETISRSEPICNLFSTVGGDFHRKVKKKKKGTV